MAMYTILHTGDRHYSLIDARSKPLGLETSRRGSKEYSNVGAH